MRDDLGAADVVADVVMGNGTALPARNLVVTYGPATAPEDRLRALDAQVATLTRQVVLLAAQLETTRPDAEAVARVLLAAGDVDTALGTLGGAVDHLVRATRVLASGGRHGGTRHGGTP